MTDLPSLNFLQPHGHDGPCGCKLNPPPFKATFEQNRIDKDEPQRLTFHATSYDGKTITVTVSGHDRPSEALMVLENLGSPASLSEIARGLIGLNEEPRP